MMLCRLARFEVENVRVIGVHRQKVDAAHEAVVLTYKCHLRMSARSDAGSPACCHDLRRCGGGRIIRNDGRSSDESLDGAPHLRRATFEPFSKATNLLIHPWVATEARQGCLNGSDRDRRVAAQAPERRDSSFVSE
jgi:hypothetical protein